MLEVVTILGLGVIIVLICAQDCPQSVYQVMLDCWNLDHRLRPKFDEIGVELETLLQNNFKSAR